MRVLFCGGRFYRNRDLIRSEMAALHAEHPDLEIICGYDPWSEHYQGADQLAYEAAKALGLPVFTFPAPWRQFGRAAGPMRNERMRADGRPDEVRAFPTPGAVNRGTEDMITKAEAAGVPVRRIEA